jgi:hypothetical protein
MLTSYAQSSIPRRLPEAHLFQPHVLPGACGFAGKHTDEGQQSTSRTA